MLQQKVPQVSPPHPPCFPRPSAPPTATRGNSQGLSLTCRAPRSVVQLGGLARMRRLNPFFLRIHLVLPVPLLSCRGREHPVDCRASVTPKLGLHLPDTPVGVVA